MNICSVFVLAKPDKIVQHPYFLRRIRSKTLIGSVLVLWRKYGKSIKECLQLDCRDAQLLSHFSVSWAPIAVKIGVPPTILPSKPVWLYIDRYLISEAYFLVFLLVFLPSIFVFITLVFAFGTPEQNRFIIPKETPIIIKRLSFFDLFNCFLY